MVNKYVVSTVQRYEVLQFAPIPHLGYFSFLSQEEKNFLKNTLFVLYFCRFLTEFRKRTTVNPCYLMQGIRMVKRVR